MVELCKDRCKSRIDIIKVHHPTGIRINLTIDGDSHEIRMTMQALTGMSGGTYGQAVHYFKAKVCIKFRMLLVTIKRAQCTKLVGCRQTSLKNADLFVKVIDTHSGASIIADSLLGG